jgi:hypothetical protein
VFPCNDIASGAAVPANISLRVVGLLRADGAVDTSTRVTTAFRDSTTATQFRTVASVNGSDIWMTGSTSVSAFHGMHYVPYGNTQTTRVVIANAANQRYVTVGPSWPGSGRPATTPQLYVSFRDGLAARGIHSINGADPLPTRNVTVGAQTTLLPGFSAYNVAVRGFAVCGRRRGGGVLYARCHSLSPHTHIYPNRSSLALRPCPPTAPSRDRRTSAVHQRHRQPDCVVRV